MDSKDSKIEHPLSLKVMRLPKPALTSPYILTCDKSDLPGDAFQVNLKNENSCPTAVQSLSIGHFLMVPQSFGTLYLGEIFSPYLCLHNDVNDNVTNITLKADLQTTTQRLPIVEEMMVASLGPNETIDVLTHHEVKEIGTHILVCEVKYSGTLSFRKFFKFQVLKPLDVKTKFYAAESDEVFLEAQVQNITAEAIFFKNVSLMPSNFFEVIDMNIKMDDENSISEGRTAIDQGSSIQFLYALKPSVDLFTRISIKSKVLDVGTLDIAWNSSLGEKGHLQTSTLQTMRTDYGEVRLSVTKIPGVVILEEPFEFTCIVSNTMDHDVELSVILEPQKGLAWCDVSGRKLRTLSPYQSSYIRLNLLPLITGLQIISGITLKDIHSDYCYQFGHLCNVYVVNTS